MSELKQLYLEFLKQFDEESFENIKNKLKANCVWFLQEQNGSSSKFSSNYVVDIKVLELVIKDELRKFKNKQLLENLISKIQTTATYNFCDECFENSINKTPSTVYNYILNFIIRNLDLNHYQSIFSQNCFEESFVEISAFLHNETFHYELIYPLYGCEGEIELIDYKGLTIKKATIETCNFFNFYYNFATPNSNLNTDISIGDFYIAIKKECKKSERTKVYNSSHLTLMKNIESLLKLSGNGNIKIGRGIVKYNDWTMFPTHASMGTNDPITLGATQFLYSLDEALSKIQLNYHCIFSKDFVLCDQIRFALDWFLKSKEETDINNKIIQLSTALEFSLKTSRVKVSKQLKQKSAVLHSFYNKSSHRKDKKAISNFYELRSDIVHGSKLAVSSQENIDIVNSAETIIRENLMLLCKLNQTYTYDEIFDFVEQASKPPYLSLDNVVNKTKIDINPKYSNIVN